MRPRPRRIWLVLGSVAAVLGLGFGTLWTVGALARETRTVVRQFDPTDLRELIVDAESGDVLVVGDRAEGEAIELTMRITEGLFGTSQRAVVRGERLEVRAGCSDFWSVHCGVRIELHVPAGLHVVVHTDNGRGRVRDLRGRVDLTSDNGDLQAERVGGRLSFDTDNGDIIGTGLDVSEVTTTTDNGDVTLFFATAPRQVTADSDNGSLEMRVPRGTDDAYALTAATDNGRVTTPIRTDPSSDRRISATSDNGDIAIRYTD